MDLQVTYDGVGRFSGRLDGQEVAFVDADPIAPASLLIKHTEVRREFEGQGLGGQLMREVLETARRQGRTVIPICPYAAAYIRKHPQYAPLVRR